MKKKNNFVRYLKQTPSLFNNCLYVYIYIAVFLARCILVYLGKNVSLSKQGAF